ncbi:MAG TPA: carboxypeptidase regulatory-like domain-containing protein [Vicinamibacteria bacterium]|jgi:hypothetical protein|nr:carboxypeptidase regulatory-like domain-containing protein [Vicinamibacteria bacterium]
MLRLLLPGVLSFSSIAARPLTADTSSGGGHLEGRVVDPYGTPLAARTVTARSLATGIERQQPSDPWGRFVFQGLPPGAYEVTISGIRSWVFTFDSATTSLLATRTESAFEAFEPLPDVHAAPAVALKGTLGRATRRGDVANGSFVVPARAFDAEQSAPALLSSSATENRHSEFEPDPSRDHWQSGWPPGFREGLAPTDETHASPSPPNLPEVTVTPQGAFGTGGTVRLSIAFPKRTGPDAYPFAFPSLPDLPPPTGTATGEEVERPIDLIVKAGTPLRVALDERVTLRRVGQPVLGTLIEPVYSYDRVVLPAGTKVVGHVEKLESVRGATRLRAILRGDLTPLRQAILRFDTLVLSDCTEIPVATQVDAGLENVSLEVAAASQKAGKLAQARQEIAQRMEQMSASLKAPDKIERLKEMLANRLPYHFQYLHRGTVYAAELLGPLNFGTVTPTPRAAPGTLAPPESVLAARLETPLDSAKTPRGTPIRAVITQPLFSSDQRLILPEGAELQGEVTFAKGAGRFHHNGQLRFLFETVQLPGGVADKLLASLVTAELGQDQHLTIDEEGGTSVPNSKSRFISPAVSLLALRATLDHDRGDRDDVGDATAGVQQGNAGGRGVGGFMGLGFLGAGLGQISRPVAVALGILGLVRSGYSALLGKGREVVIPARTPIQLQLSPASTTP